MNSLNYENIWKLLVENNFEVDLKFHSDLVCIICRKLLRNAQQGICGCRYCHSCIVEHLNKPSNICPGGTDYCKEPIMDIDGNIRVDNSANRQILGLVVKCPETFCQYSSELKLMDEHLITHQLKCPFYDIGCNHPRIKIDRIGDHLNSESHGHATLLVDYIYNLRNEIACCKEDLATKDLVLMELQSQLNESQQNIGKKFSDRLDKLERLVSNNGKDNRKLNDTINSVTSKMGEMEKDLCLKEDLIKRMERQMDEVHIAHTMQISEMQHDQLSNKARLGNIEEEASNMKAEIEKIMRRCQRKEDVGRDMEERVMGMINGINKDIQCHETSIEKLKKVFDEVKMISDQKNDQMDEAIAKLTERLDNADVQLENVASKWTSENVSGDPAVSCNEVLAPYDWKIDNFLDKRQQASEGKDECIYSIPFFSHSHGYKMCLSVFPNGMGSGKRTHLTIGFRIMKGEFDESLSWPMKHRVTISLIDQKFQVVHSSNNFKYESVPAKNRYRLDKPESDVNDGFGVTRFINLNRLCNDARLLHNGAIIVRGSVDLS